MSVVNVETYVLQEHQLEDAVLKNLHDALANSRVRHKGKEWRSQPFCRYKQIWHQPRIINGILCREYSPDSAIPKLVPLFPRVLQKAILDRNHNAPIAGHQGVEKTFHKVHQEGYWVGMFRDVVQHCENCVVCQKARSTKPPLQNIPIGKPWEMIAMDILEVPMSYQQNKYSLVVQDYFTKWATAIPLQNQTAKVISNELIHLFSVFGIPKIIHSDQGRKFESSMLRATLEVLGIEMSRTTAYHPEG